jgi:hypothetical protein
MGEDAALKGDMDQDAELKAIADSVRNNVDEVIELWRREAGEETWTHFPADLDVDHLPELIQRLADAIDSDDPESHGAQIWAAVRHGQDRLKRGFSDSLVLAEHQVIRIALWRFIRRNHGASPSAYPAIGRIDSALTLVTLAALRGYHHTALKQKGDWPAAVERLLEEWPITPG